MRGMMWWIIVGHIAGWLAGEVTTKGSVPDANGSQLAAAKDWSQK
jgi:predicted NAD/FAD-dependent oxidoreductase